MSRSMMMTAAQRIQMLHEEANRSKKPKAEAGDSEGEGYGSLVTSSDKDHAHTAQIDTAGNGGTDTVMDHSHTIVNFKVQDTNDHAHKLLDAATGDEVTGIKAAAGTASAATAATEDAKSMQLAIADLVDSLTSLAQDKKTTLDGAFDEKDVKAVIDEVISNAEGVKVPPVINGALQKLDQSDKIADKPLGKLLTKLRSMYAKGKTEQQESYVKTSLQELSDTMAFGSRRKPMQEQIETKARDMADMLVQLYMRMKTDSAMRNPMKLKKMLKGALSDSDLDNQRITHALDVMKVVVSATVPPDEEQIETNENDDIKSSLDLLDKSEEALQSAVDLMKDLAKSLRKVDPRLAGNLEQYVIGNCKVWLEDGSKGGGNTLPEIRNKLGEMSEMTEPEKGKVTETTGSKLVEAAPQKFNVSIKLTVVDPSKAADFLGGTVPVDGPEAGDIESWLMDLIPEIGKSGIRLDAVDAK